MKIESTAESLTFPAGPQSPRDVLSEILRDGAQRLLTHAIDAEVAEYLDAHAHVRNAAGHRAVVRNGYLPARTLISGVGSIEVKQPRVRDRRPADQAEKFTSKILPPYLRKTKAIEELIPWLYLKGISTSDFPETLAALVSVDAGGLSASIAKPGCDQSMFGRGLSLIAAHSLNQDTCGLAKTAPIPGSAAPEQPEASRLKFDRIG
jgi:hypothetical protein